MNTNDKTVFVLLALATYVSAWVALGRNVKLLVDTHFCRSFFSLCFVRFMPEFLHFSVKTLLGHFLFAAHSDVVFAALFLSFCFKEKASSGKTLFGLTLQNGVSSCGCVFERCEYRCSICWFVHSICLSTNWFYFILNRQCHLRSHLFLGNVQCCYCSKFIESHTQAHRFCHCCTLLCLPPLSFRSPLFPCKQQKFFYQNKSKDFLRLFFSVLCRLVYKILYFICSKDIWVPFRFIPACFRLSLECRPLSIALTHTHTHTLASMLELYANAAVCIDVIRRYA